MPLTTQILWEDVPDRVYNVTYGEFGFRCSCGYVSGGVWEESNRRSDVPSWAEQICPGCQRVYRLILQVKEPDAELRLANAPI